VLRLGGLHVILTELHEAGRIDRQVFGRCARQGDRGSVQTMLSWSDPLVGTFGGWKARWRMGHLFTFLKAQRRAEALRARVWTFSSRIKTGKPGSSLLEHQNEH
jgi:preprotein translocase subunit SecA